MIRAPDHVLDVPTQPHLWIAENGDAGPGPAGKSVLEKTIHGPADFFVVGCSRDADNAPVAIQAQSTVLLVGSGPDCPRSASVSPSCRPRVQQLDDVLLGRRFCHSSNQWLQLGFHAFFRENIQCCRDRGSAKFSEDPLSPLSPSLGRRVEVSQLAHRLRHPWPCQPLDWLPASSGHCQGVLEQGLRAICGAHRHGVEARQLLCGPVAGLETLLEAPLPALCQFLVALEFLCVVLECVGRWVSTSSGAACTASCGLAL